MSMDLATAIDETERFLTVWRTGSGPDRGRLHDVGSVIIAASLDHDAPELTTTHLETLLNALHTADQHRYHPATRPIGVLDGMTYIPVIALCTLGMLYATSRMWTPAAADMGIALVMYAGIQWIRARRNRRASS